MGVVAGSCVTAWIFRDYIGQEFEGNISGLDKAGFWVSVVTEKAAGDGWVSLASLQDDFYEYWEREEKMVGRRSKREFGLWDKVLIRVDRSEPESGYIDFDLIAWLE